MDSLRQQAIELETARQQNHAEQLARWTAEKPFLKDTIAGLSQTREMFLADIKQAEANMRSIASIGADPQTTASWFSWQQQQQQQQQEKPSEFAELSDEALLLELDRFRKALSHIDGQLQVAKDVFTKPRKEQERDIWEAQLIILQDSRRINQEEIDRLEFEKNSRARLQKLAKERAVAEASGVSQMAGLQEKLASVETKLNQLKQQLYFPDVKGYKFAFGGRGIYFGGKDVMVSELSGNFALSAEAVNADKPGALPTAKVTMQIGGGAPASFQRANDTLNAVANRAASTTQSFKLRPTSATQSYTDTVTDTPDAMQPPSAAPTTTQTQSLPSQASRHTVDGTQAPAHSSSNASSTQALPADASHTQPGQDPPTRQLSSQQAANRALARHHSSAAQESSVSNVQQQQQNQQQQQHQQQRGQQQQQQQKHNQQRAGNLDLHQNDVWSPLRASAPQQDVDPTQNTSLFDRQQSSMHASTSGPSASEARGLPPRGPALPPEQQHQSRSKRFANKLLKKMGTKERFKHPQSGDTGLALSGSNPASQARPAYSPDVFDASPKKGSKLAQRLLGKSTNSSTRLSYGSHVAGRSHHRWSDGLETAGFEPSANAADVQQDVLEAATDAEAAPQTPRTPITEDLEYPSPGIPNPRLTSDYTFNLPVLDGSDARMPTTNAYRATSIGDSAFDGNVPEDRHQSDLPGQDPQYSSYGGVPQIGAKGTRGKVRSAFSKMAHGVTGDSGEGSSERGSEGGLDSVSQGSSNRKGLLVVVRLSEVGLIGEKGTKVPNTSIAEISLEVELSLTFKFDYSRVQGWHTATKPVFEVFSLERKARGTSVPLPKAIIKYILSAVLPRVLQRKLLGALPAELGQYLLEAGQGARLTGEIAVVGPPLSCLDADLAFQGNFSAPSKDARQVAQMNAAAQEARSLLGLSSEQAEMLAELFSGKGGLLAEPCPCNLAQLQTYFNRHSEDPQAWGSLCNIWDMALGNLARSRGSTDTLDFRMLMQQHVGHQLLKPVRARFALTQASVSINLDAMLTSVRDFFERSARELHAKEQAMGHKIEGSEPLDEQLQVLAAWYSFCAGKLRVFKSKFKHAACSVVGQADARSFAVGAERVSYEGPLRVRLPVKKKLDPNGDFSFEVPLPNPDRQVLVKRFAGGLKGALKSPLTAQRTQTAPTAQTTSDGSQSAGGTEDEEVPDWGQENSGKTPLKLGKVIVNGMRVRVRLDQQRLASMLQDLSPAALGSRFADVTSGMLGMLGDMASLSFAPYTPEDGSPPHYVLNMESSDVSNLNAEVLAVGFSSGDNISPGRMLRLVHAITRGIMLTTGTSAQALGDLDKHFDAIHKLLTQEALGVSVLMAAESRVLQSSSTKPLMVYVSGTGDNSRETTPAVFTNDVELVSLLRFLKGDSSASSSSRGTRG